VRGVDAVARRSSERGDQAEVDRAALEPVEIW
jgi:hypothetical protein